MSFLSSVFTSSTASFIGKHILLGLIRTSGYSVKMANTKARNTQCVKLTKKHECVIQMVKFWCGLRILKQQQLGIEQETVDRVVLNDARFLTALTYAIDAQKNREPEYDAWLFFNEDVESTDFFELQQCDRGSKVTKISYVIHAY